VRDRDIREIRTFELRAVAGSPVKSASLVFLWKNLTGQAPVKSSTNTADRFSKKIGGTKNL